MKDELVEVTQADPIEARISELQALGWDWWSAYLRAKIDQHAAAFARHRIAALREKRDGD